MRSLFESPQIPFRKGFLLFATIAFSLAGQLSAVDIYPGTNIQSVVNANPAGTTYVLKSGIHRLQSITPKAGDIYQGESGAILSGATEVTSFAQQGPYWVAGAQTQQGTINMSVPCQPGWEGCEYPEQLFFDDVLLQHVASLGLVGPGKWYFDYAGHNIYVSDNPTGHRVETSVTSHAFVSGGSNVKIQNLIIEKYATASQDGALALDASMNWVVQANEIRLNHGTGIRLGHSTQVIANYVHHNGQMGLGGGSENILVDGNEIAYNNAAHFDYQGSNGEAGGVKFSQNSGLTASNNYVHNNDGPGLWLDGSNYSWRIEANRTMQNSEVGILDEISYDGIIRYNVVEGEGSLPSLTQTSFWYRAGIQVASSPNAEIYGNTLINCWNGIGAIAINRGSGNRGPFVLQNLYVHDNTIVQVSGYAAGVVADAGELNTYTSLNNRFVNNTYKLANPTGVFYEWYAGGPNYVDMTGTQWTSAGEDIGGTWLPSDSPVPSTQFATGDRVTLTAATAVMSLPTTSGTIVSTLGAGAQGTVTQVRGPVYSNGATWWQVLWDSSARGWTPALSMSSGSDTTPPTIGITYPYNNTTVSGVVGVTTIASDNVGVTEAQFYVDGALMSTNTAPPWGFSWNTSNLSAGNHVLSAWAYDAANNRGGAAITVNIGDNIPPTIRITYPNNNTTVSGVVAVTAIATDNVGVTQVQFYVDGVLMATNTAPPWGFSWNTSKTPTGTHTLSAIAHDAANNSGVTSMTVTVAGTGPAIGITSPLNGATVSGVVKVTNIVTDDVGIVKVNLYIDNRLVATTTAAPWSLSWTTANSPPGSHVLLTRAYDTAGNTGGAVITVIVKR